MQQIRAQVYSEHEPTILSNKEKKALIRLSQKIFVLSEQALAFLFETIEKHIFAYANTPNFLIDVAILLHAFLVNKMRYMFSKTLFYSFVSMTFCPWAEGCHKRELCCIIHMYGLSLSFLTHVHFVNYIYLFRSPSFYQIFFPVFSLDFFFCCFPIFLAISQIYSNCKLSTLGIVHLSPNLTYKYPLHLCKDVRFQS